MADVHAHKHVRGKPAKLACGAPWGGSLISGDPAKVTCSKCKGEKVEEKKKE